MKFNPNFNPRYVSYINMCILVILNVSFSEKKFDVPLPKDCTRKKLPVI